MEGVRSGVPPRGAPAGMLQPPAGRKVAVGPQAVMRQHSGNVAPQQSVLPKAATAQQEYR